MYAVTSLDKILFNWKAMNSPGVESNESLDLKHEGDEGEEKLKENEKTYDICFLVHELFLQLGHHSCQHETCDIIGIAFIGLIGFPLDRSSIPSRLIR